MQKSNNPTKKYQIPRYLGLRSVDKKKGGYEVALGFAEKNQIDLTLDQDGLDLLLACQSPKSVAELGRSLKLKEPQIKKALATLVKARVVAEVATVPANLKRYDRHLLFYQLKKLNAVQAQKVLSRSTIALIGVGGIGNWAALAAIGAGFKEIRLIDFDTIELSNLTRQVLFKEEHLGKAKIAVAAKELSARNKNTRTVPINVKVDSAKQLDKVLRGVDFVLLSADRPDKIHDWVDEVCIKHKIPYLNLGYRDDEGVIGPLTVAGQTSCYQCFKPKPAPAETSPKVWSVGKPR